MKALKAQLTGGIWDREMNSFEFSDKLSHFPEIKKHFEGIFSADNLPKKIKKNSFIVCNTDVSAGPGKHWYCIVKLNTTVLECFDSLGIDNVKKSFITSNLRQKGISKIQFNVTQVQSSDSDTCGFFVLYFLIHRYHNKDLSFNELMNEIFVLSQTENEKLVHSFAADHF